MKTSEDPPPRRREDGPPDPPCHSSSCFLAFLGDVLAGAVWARPRFPPTASLLPSSSSRTGLYLRTTTE